jgi:hypothetical protein
LQGFCASEADFVFFGCGFVKPLANFSAKISNKNHQAAILSNRRTISVAIHRVKRRLSVFV